MLLKSMLSLSLFRLSRQPLVVTKTSVRCSAMFKTVGQPQSQSNSSPTRHVLYNEIGIESGCLMWGIRVIIPKSLQARILETLHENHPGMTRINAIARSYIWWSGLDKHIEEKAKSCQKCQETREMPAAAPLHPWIWPTVLWKRVYTSILQAHS